jgi:hypothetical protein
MLNVDLNVKFFNQHGKVNWDGIAVHGCPVMTILLTVSDCDFVRYMRNKKDSYDDGEDF